MAERCLELQRSEEEGRAAMIWTFERLLTCWRRGLLVLTETVDRLITLGLTDEQRHHLADTDPWLFGAYEYAKAVQGRGGDLGIPQTRR